MSFANGPHDRYVRSHVEVRNQRGEVVMTVSALNFFLCRDASRPESG